MKNKQTSCDDEGCRMEIIPRDEEAHGEEKGFGQRKQEDEELIIRVDLTDISFYPYGLNHEDPVFAVVGVGTVSCTSTSPLPPLHPTNSYTDSHIHMVILPSKLPPPKSASSTQAAQPRTTPNQQSATSAKRISSKTSPSVPAASHGLARRPSTSLSSASRNRRIGSSRSLILTLGSAFKH